MDPDGLQWRQRNMIFGVIYYHGPFLFLGPKTQQPDHLPKLIYRDIFP